jgi:phage terminase large subunit-like protein
VKAGPKADVESTPLPFASRKAGAARFAAFCAQYVNVPKGQGARAALRLRPWQLRLVDSVWGANPRPRLAGWMLPRGQGKSTLCAALGLWDLMLGEEGAQVVVAACDERQASIVFKAAARMVELQPELEARVQVYADRLTVPARAASFQVLPAVAKRLEGLDPTLAILDEAGRIDREVYEVVALATGKRETSTILGIGTPGPDLDESVLGSMRAYALDHPDDASFVWREHSAAGFEDHPVDCRHCWRLANPALGDFLYETGLSAVLPPKMREASFRRARLCQLVGTLDEAWLPPGAWDDCTEPGPIPDGDEVVLGLDGSFSQDCTALVAVSTARCPHVDVVGLWEPPVGAMDYRVPVADVEEAIRQACRRWQVREIVADPFRWTRTIQALEAEKLPAVEFPQSPARMTPATTGFFEAVVNLQLSHSGDPRLARHIGNCTLKEDARGTRLTKDRKHSTRRIDLAVAAVMAHARASEHPPPPRQGPWAFWV